MHVFVFYAAALTAVLAMSTACLGATESGYFRFEQVIDQEIKGRGGEHATVDYEVGDVLVLYSVILILIFIVGACIA